MIRKRKCSKPFDLSHSILFNEFPKEYTSTIGVPGKFAKKCNRRVHLKDGTSGEMDSAYIADSDNRILFERVAVGLEHQSIPVGEKKLNKFGDYDIQLVVDEHLPTLLVVTSHLNEDKSKNKLIRSPSDITQLYFLDLGEENISQRLSTVSKIIYNNQYLSQEMALNLGVIALYAPRERACEIMDTVVSLYLQIVEKLDLHMEYTLYSVITVLLDAFFDDEDEYRRLTKMMDDNTSQESQMRFASHESTIESLTYAEEDLANARDDLAHTKNDLAKANGKIADLEAEVKRLTDELNGK